MAKCFDVVGYVEPCIAVRPKYTGRALLIVAKGFLPIGFSSNGMIIENIMEKTSFKELFNAIAEAQNLNFYPVSIYAENPFGVTIQGNTDSGRAMYTKTIPVSIPSVLNDAELFIMGLQKGMYGSAAIVLESSGGSDVSDFFGAYSTFHIDPTSVTRNEYENGGAWTFNIVCDDPVPNVICMMTDLSDTLDTLLNA